MGEYRLSQSAKHDLIAIAQYGDEHFGVAQSNRYRDQLKQRFSVLAEQPQLYPAVDHIRPGYHRSVCGAHSIYYRIDAQGVEIMRILKHQDPSKAFQGTLGPANKLRRRVSPPGGIGAFTAARRN